MLPLVISTEVKTLLVTSNAEEVSLTDFRRGTRPFTNSLEGHAPFVDFLRRTRPSVAPRLYQPLAQ